MTEVDLSRRKGATRAQTRENTEREIMRLAREALARDGAGALSLRSIARDLGVASSAVYRYVASRDELITALVVQAYADLAQAAADAAAAAGAEPRDRLTAALAAMRTWAVSDPARWTLLYGTPVPGYQAPAEQTNEVGTRLIAALLHEIAAADSGAASPSVPVPVPVPARVSADLGLIRAEFGLALDDGRLIAAVTLWSAAVGAISLEVFGGYGEGTFADLDGLFAAQMELLISLVL